jgi:PAS domain S-box-containing protein
MAMDAGVRCLGALLAATPGLHLLLSADDTYRIVGASDAYLRATMTERAAILGRPLFEVFPDPPDDPTADGVRNLAASLARVRSAGRPDRMPLQRYPIRRPEAEGGGYEERFWEPLNTPVLAPDGSVEHIIHTVADVTDRVRDDTALSRAEGLLRIAGRMARIGGWSVEVGTGALSWSDEVCEIHGVAPGTPVTLDGAIAFHAPEYRDQVRAALVACATSGTSYDQEREILTAKGERRWVRAIGEAVRDAHGRIVRVQGAFQDITPLKRAEAGQLRLLEKAVARLKDLVVITEAGPIEPPGPRIVFVNRAFEVRTGWSAAAAIGQTLRILHGPGTDRATLERIRAAMAAARPIHAELINYTRAGDPFWLEVDLVPLSDETGALSHWVAVQRDITARKRDEAIGAFETAVFGLIAAGAPLGDVLATILHAVEELSPGALASFVLLDEDGIHMRPGSAPSLPEAFSRSVDGVAIGPCAGSCGTAMHLGRPVVTVDIETDPLWEQIRPLARAHGLRACWSTPVKRADGKVAASFALYWREPRAPSDDDRALIARISGLASIAIERGRTLEALRESEQRFQAVASATADVAWDWDLKRNTVWWGEDVGQVFGHDRDALCAGPDARAAHIHPEDRARVLDGVAAAIARRDRLWEDEYRFLRRDGTVVHVEDRGRLIIDEHGQPVRFVGGMRDVTERIEAQARIAELQQRLNTLVSEAKVGILVHHAFQPILANAELARMLGYGDAAEILALEDIRVLFAESERARLTGYYEARLAGREAPGFFAVKGRRRDGAERDLETRAFRIDWGGRPAVCAMLTDVTERRAMEERLLKSQRLEAMGQLTGGIAHDFNNLLTIILGNAEMLSETLAAESPLRPLAEMTRSAAERGAELTSRLLAFARRQALDPKATDIDALLGSMAAMLRRTLGEHVEIVLAPGRGVPHALVDAGQLENAILNLCINARDAMGGGGQLTIATESAFLERGPGEMDADLVPGTYVMVAVSDTGCGMSPDVLARAFDPFFTTKEVGKGSGLGLSMVYGFAKQSRGHVRIQSEPGRGTVVRLYLPPAVTPLDTAEPSYEPAPAPGGRETILVVEDDALVRQHVIGMLETLGYRVLGAANGREAIEQLRAHPEIDLLFTDVVMPGGMNGRTLADAAQALRPELPVLFTSGYTEDAIVHHGRLDPDVHLLRKPYRRQELAARLRQLLNRRDG